MLWISVYDSMFQFLPISSKFTQPLKRSGPTFHRPQSTTWSTLCEVDVLHCVRQMVVTPDTDWLSDPPQMEDLPQATRSHGCCCSDNPSGAPFYASSTEVSTKVWPLSTDRFDVWDICYKRTSESPPLVERANKYHEMFSAGHVLRKQLITTDASMRGWGVMLNGTWVRGHWEPPWTSQHINVLESRAIHLALGNSLPNLADRHILVRTDNVVAAPYMNRKGGLTSLLLCKVSHNLLTWAQPHILSLKAVHLLGLQTQAADMLSRGGPWPEEWRLHPDVVKIIWDHFWDGKKNLIQKYCINKNKNTVFYLIHLKLRYLLVYFKTNCDVSLPKPANRCANGNALVKVQHKSWHNAPFTIKKEFAIE